MMLLAVGEILVMTFSLSMAVGYLAYLFDIKEKHKDVWWIVTGIIIYPLWTMVYLMILFQEQDLKW